MTRMGDNADTNVSTGGVFQQVPNRGILGLVGYSARGIPHHVQALAWRTADYLVKNWKAVTT